MLWNINPVNKQHKANVSVYHLNRFLRINELFTDKFTLWLSPPKDQLYLSGKLGSSSYQCVPERKADKYRVTADWSYIKTDRLLM